jgi:hypothetical protein
MLTQDQKNVIRAYNLMQPDPYAALEINGVLSDSDAAILINTNLKDVIKNLTVKVANLPNNIAHLQGLNKPELAPQIAAAQSQLASAQAALASASTIKAANDKAIKDLGG